jgi:hypothetical protein
VTRGVSRLSANLEARTRLDYPAPVRHVLICDADDLASRVTCHRVAAAHPELDVCLVLVEGDPGTPVPKLVKLQAGMPRDRRDPLSDR